MINQKRDKKENKSFKKNKNLINIGFEFFNTGKFILLFKKIDLRFDKKFY